LQASELSQMDLPVIFLNRLRFDRIMVMSLWPRFFGPRCIHSVSYSSNLTMITAKKTSIRAVADGPARRAATRASCCVTQRRPRGYERIAQTQCRINANRGPWQLFARAPLLTPLRETETYHSQPLESIRHVGNYFVPISIRPILYIFCCRSYVKLLDY